MSVQLRYALLVRLREAREHREALRAKGVNPSSCERSNVRALPYPYPTPIEDFTF